MLYAPLSFDYDLSQDDGKPNRAPHAGEALARQPEKFRDFLGPCPTPNTGTAYLTRALQKHLPSLLLTDGVAVPDDPEEMRWRLFFAHSQDMQGFRADIFTGGPFEEDNPYFPHYQGLRDRWSDGRSMIEGLADLWQNPEARKTLEAISNPFRSQEEKSQGIAPAMNLLRGPKGNAATCVFADAFDELKGYKIAHKTNAIIRAYCQNAAVLAPHDYCMRTYLLSAAPDFSLPQTDVTSTEAVWREQIMRDFYHVGPAMAPYLIADWLFGLWRAGQIEWFDSYKADSVWLKSLAGGTRTGEQVIPPEAAATPEAFVAYCKTLVLPPQWIPARLWHLAFYNLPPRLVNEVLWLEEAATGEQLKTSQASSNHVAAAKPAVQSNGLPANTPVSADTDAAAKTGEVDEDGSNETMAYIPLLNPVSQSSTDTENVLQAPIRLLSYQDLLYLMAFTSLEAGEQFLQQSDFPRLTQPLQGTIDLLKIVLEADTRIAGTIFNPGTDWQYVKMREEILEIKVQEEIMPAADILSADPLSEAVAPEALSALIGALVAEGIEEAWGTLVTRVDMHRTWLITIPTSDTNVFAKVWHRIMEALRQWAGNQQDVPDVAICDLRTSQIARHRGEELPLGQDSPADAMGQTNEQASDFSDYCFVTNSGRAVYLSRLLLTQTFEGHLEGTAETISRYVRRNIKSSLKAVLPKLAATYIIDNDVSQPLPPLQWVVEFASNQPVHTHDPDYGSRLGVCWFSAKLPKDLAVALENVLTRVDYDRNAEDVDLMP